MLSIMFYHKINFYPLTIYSQVLNTLLEQTFEVEVILSFAFSFYQVCIAYILDQIEIGHCVWNK